MSYDRARQSAADMDFDSVSKPASSNQASNDSPVAASLNSPAGVVQMQRTHGNRTTTNMIQRMTGLAHEEEHRQPDAEPEPAPDPAAPQEANAQQGGNAQEDQAPGPPADVTENAMREDLEMPGRAQY